MEPSNIRFAGGPADTILTPFFVVVMLLALVLVLFLPRKYAVVPLFLGVFLIPVGQVEVVAGLHFIVMRILILVGLGRWAVSRIGQRGGVFAGGFNSIDRLFMLFAIFQFMTFSIEWMAMPAVIKSLAALLDALGGYVLVRSLIRNEEDIRLAIKALALVAVVAGICMLGEQITRHNVFGLLAGGNGVPAERAGKIRAQGPFAVYLTAGAFGATLLPLLVWLWAERKSRLIAYLGIAGATVMTVTSNSSTSDVIYVASILALCAWPLRARLRVIRWGFVAIVVGLNMVMKAPVWALIGRLDLTGSSDADHRYRLVDNFIRHFGDWWLLGFKDYQQWGWDMWDLSNQFVYVGLNGGLVTFALFVAVIVLCFAGLGRARKRPACKLSERWLFWCLGATLFAHLVGFFGLSYWDQVQFDLYALIAMISVAASLGTRNPAPTKAAADRNFEAAGKEQTALSGAFNN